MGSGVRTTCASTIDRKDFFEDISIQPEDIHETLTVTPDGLIAWTAMKIEGCNARQHEAVM